MTSKVKGFSIRALALIENPLKPPSYAKGVFTITFGDGENPL